MRRATVSDLKTRALLMADIPADSTSRSDAVLGGDELLAILNDAAAEIHTMMVEASEDWLTTKTTLYMGASQQSTYLPSDFLKLKRFFLIDSGTRNKLGQWKMDDLESNTTTDTSNRPDYKLMSDRLWWHPLPDAEYELELWYVRQFHPLTHNDDELDPLIPSGWEMYIVASMAEYMLDKEERDPRPAIRRKERAEARIKQALSQRQLEPIRITDRNNRFGPARPRLPRYKA